MEQALPIRSALISVFHKDGLAPIVEKLNDHGVTIYSTGGTEQFIKELGIPVVAVEDLTEYPSILGGRVKTLHPKIFGGILNRQNHEGDQSQMAEFSIPQIDLVIVDLYPFEQTVASGADAQAIIEKIDIGGISLIRAAAKNFADTFCLSSVADYQEFLDLLKAQNGTTTLAQRKRFAAKAFACSSHYDTAIFNYFNQETQLNHLKLSVDQGQPLRYGENPHQKGEFFGAMDQMFDKLHGKELSYNNLLDVDAAVQLMNEFQGSDASPCFAILKHNNACGMAQGNSLSEAYAKALAADPVSAFGGVLIANQKIDLETAEQIHELFCEVVIAPGFSQEALALLSQKKNRIILVQKLFKQSDLTVVTDQAPTQAQIDDLLFASVICKHTKSNTIVFVKDGQLYASGTGQTSRVDALRQAIEKAKSFNFDLNGAVMASDAFFPFPDCVEIADRAGIKAVIQPGGSIKDQMSIDYCNAHNLSMVFTGTRHFKH
ncbi:MAG: bifunctional phosphoribosylaminoimidazolecarboxamide formyltransferase/IMP cyclohydrolase PurH [Flavobacteriaceae bacterium]|nr:bifunctional phosphoribosylaminoimidazolecarboxamide formyltransferase/IMP cyclohydrolase PurH [Flavobacteriaceae bacterium]